MDQEEYNRLLQNAIEQIKAEAEQKFEERLKAVEADREAQIKVAEDRLTKKFDDEVREVRQAFEESRGANPTTRDTTLMRGLGIMTEAVVAANNHPHLSHHSRRVRGQSLSSFKLPRTLATFRVNLKLHDHDSDSDSESESADSRAGDSEPRWAPHPISMWAPPGQASVAVCLGCPWDPNGRNLRV